MTTTDEQPDYDRYEELSDLDESELDAIRRALDEFGDRVDWLVRQIPTGLVATYGQIALYAGSPRAARAVGNLMRSCHDRGVVLPWHRVINASGGISGRGDISRVRRQKRRLRDEGIDFDGSATCDLNVYRWEPDALFWDEDERD
jgi:methylated-DNA-protein-cysteine methyltransferase-like protein